MSMWVIGISTVVSLAGTAVSVYAQNQAADAAETTAMLNANEQKKQANREAEVAAENARRAEREKTRYLASQRAQLAASGLAMEGTPLAVLGDTAQALELQILDLGSEAANRMRALRQGAALSLYEGKSQASALRTQSIATGLDGLSSAAGGYLKASGSVAPKTSSYLG
jgi:hypothetical protein